MFGVSHHWLFGFGPYKCAFIISFAPMPWFSSAFRHFHSVSQNRIYRAQHHELRAENECSQMYTNTRTKSGQKVGKVRN